MRNIERIKFKADIVKSAVYNFCHTEGRSMDDKYDMGDIYSAFCDIMEELDLYDEVIHERTYYVLPIDSYGQPVGYVEERKLTPYQASKIPYCFENAYTAQMRAQY